MVGNPNECIVFNLSSVCSQGRLYVSDRTLQSLLAEFQAVRSATEKLFETLTEAQSKSQCNVVTHPMTARAIGYFIIGHVQHHRKIIEERYL